MTAETADAIRKNKKASTTVNQPSVDAVDALKMQINELKEEKKRLYGQLDQFSTFTGPTATINSTIKPANTTIATLYY
ncbi:hypothetical protein [Carnobacterium viridans]|uniref:Uncharacterized protein n=1 Tax=Carnobacterium viridans TaxID=174587 RepID=A0A1H0XID9_9LACT|nr:hypothetical protein [Carnobacterium viridans]SDQ02700.1 hypothetical protein SAMN04487752_0229 [Carnobacterium viridans]